jgi:ribonuclease D
LITGTEEFEAFLLRLEQHDRIGLDTEADSLHCYFEKLCLLQFSVPGEDALVDPLADLDFTALFPLLAKKIVVMHGADYDLRLLKRYGTFAPGELIDTMHAARLSGEPQLGLAALIEKYFGVTLCKASQRANWALRPLSSKMTEYALNDTRYLLELADHLLDRIDRLGRREWLRESIERMQRAAAETRDESTKERWKISGYAALPPRGQAILRALWEWRESEARSWDRPSFHVMSNQDLLAHSSDALQGQRLNPRLPTVRKKRFFASLEAALELPEADWPVKIRVARQRPAPEKVQRFNQLKILRDRKASELGLDTSIVASKAALEAVAFADDPSHLMRWQKQILELE